MEDEKKDVMVVDTEAQIVIQPPDNPKEQFAKLQELAICWKPFIELNSTKIGNSKYPHVETYQAMAGTHGCSLSIPPESVIYDSNLKGWKATGQVVRMSDGKVIATAIAFLGDDEPLWKNRPTHAKRAMVQTRAMSRVGRSVFAYIIVLSGAKVKTTPAEEMPPSANDRTQSANGDDKKVALDMAFHAYELGNIDTKQYKEWQDRIEAAKTGNLLAMIKALKPLSEKAK